MKTPAADQWVAEGEIPSLFSCCLGETRPALLRWSRQDEMVFFVAEAAER